MPHIARRFRIIKLRKWFPPEDPLAAKVARLCILREDFLLEMQGIYTEEIKALDEHSEQWRRMYFFRNLVRTLMEIVGAIQTLLVNPEFKSLLAKQPVPVQTEFEKLRFSIMQGHPVIKEVRNAVGGHVLESAVKKSLEGMDSEHFGFLEAAPIAKNTHYKFAGELVAEILVAGVPAEERIKIHESTLAKIADLFPVFSLIERILVMYAEDRGLP